MIKNVSIQDPVVVDLLTGQVYESEISRKKGMLMIKGIPLADYPIAVVSRELASMKS
jgi:hypothetical protein